MDKQKKYRLYTLFVSWFLIYIGFGTYLYSPIIDDVDVGFFVFLGFLVFSCGFFAWSVRRLNKKDKQYGRSIISNKKYYMAMLVVSLALLITSIVLVNFDLIPWKSKVFTQQIDPRGPISLGVIILLLAAIVVYDKYFKKTRGGKGGIRRGWTEDEKRQVRRRQDGRCNKCGDTPPRWEYHHRDGNRSNNSLENCEGLCPNCHSVKTHG